MRVFRSAARWIFLVTLFVAPWMYGGTTATSIATINLLLGAALVLWVLDLLVNRRFPLLPRIFVGVSVALLSLGWWMVLNASSIYDSQFYLFIPLRRFIDHAPGSVDYAISVAWMLRATLLIGATWLAAELSQDSHWLLRLWWTIGVAGASIALLGLVQKATGAEMIFWQHAFPDDVKTFFATYYYHANAGAFLNLVLPPIAGLAIRAFTKPESSAVRALWLSTLIFIIVAVVANTSRLAQLIALGMMIALTIRFARRVFDRLSKTERGLALVSVVVVLFTLFAVAQASHLDQPLKRWHSFKENFLMDARWIASRSACDALGDAGLLGFGPGTFRVVFPYYTAPFANRITGVWRFLHNDYLQTTLEGGWLGASLCGFLFFGGIAVGVRTLWRGRRARFEEFCGRPGGPYSTAFIRSPRQRLFLTLSIFALCGVALHALADFPLQIASLQLYVATYLGVCWGAGGDESRK